MSIELKHTPAPWKIGVAITKNNALAIFDDRAKEGNDKNMHRCICLITEPQNADDEDFANAALLIHTPDLLRVLVEAKWQIEYLHDKFNPTGTGNATLARIDCLLEQIQATYHAIQI